MQIAGLELIEPERQVVLRCQPEPLRALLDEATLTQWLQQAGYASYRLLPGAVSCAVKACNECVEAFEMPVAERCDSSVQIQIAADDMRATLSLTAAQGGTSASEEDVMRALSEAGVTFGIDTAAVLRACTQGACQDALVASGVAAVDGIDTVFEELIPDTASREPKLDENGRIDYREHGAVTVVQAGAALMRRTPATVGFDGVTVRGRVLAAKHGAERPFAPQLSGAQVSCDDPNLLEAEISGQPVRVDGGVMVEPVLRVGEVNMASGNIHFEGTVEVAGEVAQGMKIEASGDIVVTGLVDGAVLRAGGDIRVAAGVIAKAQLHATGSVSARFAQGARIEAGNLIALSEMAMECELESLNQIIIGGDAPKRGRLSGGVTTAMTLLSVPVLGLAKGAVTRVILGANRELDASHEALQHRIMQEKASEENLARLIKQLSANGDPKGMLERVKASRQHALEVWGKSLAEQVELEAEMALANTARLEVGVAVAGAVNLSFGKVNVPVRLEFDAGAFWLNDEGKVMFTDASGIAVAADSLQL